MKWNLESRTRGHSNFACQLHQHPHQPLLAATTASKNWWLMDSLRFLGPDYAYLSLLRLCLLIFYWSYHWINRMEGSQKRLLRAGFEHSTFLSWADYAYHLGHQAAERIKWGSVNTGFPLPLLSAFLLSDLLASNFHTNCLSWLGHGNQGWAHLLISSLTIIYPAHRKIEVQWRQSWQR